MRKTTISALGMALLTQAGPEINAEAVKPLKGSKPNIVVIVPNFDALFFQPSRYSAIEGLFFAGGWAGDNGFEPTLGSGIAAAKSIIRRLGKT